ncbi:zinc finger protein 664 [Stylonychia lemnae]|uniref:Zinc finger protein 664 n=1 Tax=Stylonychia lemnae TaxID=5949 RepID=A0A077ZQX9_STYLE|nr:zinc finger protein 664 [Stylonychia lemnae]|eukprot:CDW72303.1 zinc finger protein 664 [Stylonychia lemnae]
MLSNFIVNTNSQSQPQSFPLQILYNYPSSNYQIITKPQIYNSTTNQPLYILKNGFENSSYFPQSQFQISDLPDIGNQQLSRENNSLPLLIKSENNQHSIQPIISERQRADSCICKCQCGALGDDFLIKHKQGIFLQKQLNSNKDELKLMQQLDNDNQIANELTEIDESYATKQIKQILKLPERSQVQITLGEHINKEQLPNVPNIPALKTYKQVKIYKQELKKWKTLFICTFNNCNTVCQKWGTLYDHLRTHSNERPFQCPVELCLKTFTQKSNLEKHIKTHKRSYLKCCKCKAVLHKDRLLRHFNKNHYESQIIKQKECGVKQIDELITPHNESEKKEP